MISLPRRCRNSPVFRKTWPISIMTLDCPRRFAGSEMFASSDFNAKYIASAKPSWISRSAKVQPYCRFRIAQLSQLTDQITYDRRLVESRSARSNQAAESGLPDS